MKVSPVEDYGVRPPGSVQNLGGNQSTSWSRRRQGKIKVWKHSWDLKQCTTLILTFAYKADLIFNLQRKAGNSIVGGYSVAELL